MEIKRNLLFFVDKEKAESGYKPDGKLRLRIRYASGKVDFNVGYRVTIEKWLNEAQRCKPGTSHGKKKISASEINREIQRLEEQAEDVFKAFEVAEHTPTIEEYRNAFNASNDRKVAPKVINFFTYFDEFVDESGISNNWTYATQQKFASVRNHLLEFDERLSFDRLTENKLNDYVTFLRDIKDMRNSTIGKQIGFLKWFLRWSVKKGYNNELSFQTFKPKLKNTQKKVIFLDWEELTQLRNYQVPENKQYLDRVKDVFVFQCFTGLRYSDVYNLRRSDLKGDHIEITTVKTADSLTIELNNYSCSILEKYKDIHFPDGKVLPVISNQKMNDYLKELGELAGLDEEVRETYYRGNERIDEVTPKYKLLGTHAGRRTFICNALAMGIPAQTVMKWTGHSDYKAMKPYIDIADKDKQEAMTLWDKKEESDDSKLLDQLKGLPKDKLVELLEKIKTDAL